MTGLLLKPPPGLMGEIVRFTLDSAPRPTLEAGVAAALGTVAGITGRYYNVNGSGLSLNILLTATTGSGKEAVRDSTTYIFDAVSARLPSVMTRYGPSEFASGPSIHKMLQTQPCFVSILGEFGQRLCEMSHPRASESARTLMRTLLELYSMSGKNKMFNGKQYADEKNNIHAVRSPAVTIVGEGTTDSVFGALTEQHMEAGLVPRFIFITRNNKERPKPNKTHYQARPNKVMIDHLFRLARHTMQIEQQFNAEENREKAKRKIIDVAWTKEASEIDDQMNEYADQQMDGSGEDNIKRHLWNRAHLNFLRVSGLLAVTTNFKKPRINEEQALWTSEFIRWSVDNTLANFGQLGTADLSMQRRRYLIRFFHDFFGMSRTKRRRYGQNKEYLHDSTKVPLSYLLKRAGRVRAFREEHKNLPILLENTLRMLEAEGVIMDVQREGQGLYFTRGESWRGARNEL